jgi:predicted nucleic acid-binding Zn ribbon protein
MPTYVYEITDGPDTGERLEIRQSIHAAPLKVHPDTGAPVRRVLSTPTIMTPSAGSAAVKDDKKLGNMGFTKYVKSGDGTYEKTAGHGPKSIRRDANGS